MTSRLVSVIGIVFVILVLVLVVVLTPEPVIFKTDVGSQILPLLFTLLFVALLLERALEVFISTWRGTEAERLEQVLSDLQRNAAALKAEIERATAAADIQATQQAYTDELAKLGQAEQNKTEFRSGTKRRAMWMGLVLGLLVSAVGVRALQPLIDADSLLRLSANQLIAFHLVDVLVTGGCLAGGSDAIHKIIQLYVDFTEKTSDKVKASGNG
jgi:hypothetical protein